MTDDGRRGLYEAFGRLLRQQRDGQADRMTQDRLAALIGLSRTSITNIEKGRQHVSLHHLYLIADALGVAPEMLLPPAPNPGVSELAQRLPAGTEPKIAKWADNLLAR